MLIITEELAKVSDDIIVAVGQKKVRKFRHIIDPNIKVIRDDLDLGSPISGIVAGLDRVKHRTSAIVACDLPFVKSEVLGLLYRRCLGHSAAVPIWPNGNMEPLCAVYKVSEAKSAVSLALGKHGKIGPRHLITQMKDVMYVDVSDLRQYDKSLMSLFNVNSQKEYATLLRKIIPKT